MCEFHFISCLMIFFVKILTILIDPHDSYLKIFRNLINLFSHGDSIC